MIMVPLIRTEILSYQIAEQEEESKYHNKQRRTM